MLPLESAVRIGIWPPARKLALTPLSVVRFGSASVRTRFLVSSALIMAEMFMPPAMTLPMKAENVSASALGPAARERVWNEASPPKNASHCRPSSRPAARWASRIRTSRLTWRPPDRVMALIIPGPPYWAAMSMAFCIETSSGTEPESLTRPLTVSARTSEAGMAWRIEVARSRTSAPTSTDKSPTG